jgi:putative membrane protein
MRRLLTTSAMAVLLASPVSAQIGNPAGVEPGTPQSGPGMPAPGYPNTQDRLFARLVAAGGIAEVDFAKLAEQKAQKAEVKEFARQMAQDHSKANAQLEELAKQARLPLPNELDPDHKAMRADLEKLSGGQFDAAYMRGQVVDHQKTALLMQWEIAFGQDGDIQRFAAQNLPTILQHLQMAQNLMSELTGQTPQGAAPEVAMTSSGAADRRPGAETGRPADREAPRARGRETR